MGAPRLSEFFAKHRGGITKKGTELLCLKGLKSFVGGTFWCFRVLACNCYRVYLRSLNYSAMGMN